MTSPDWHITQEDFDPQRQYHHETIFTIGNGYLSTRGAFEEAIRSTGGPHLSTACSMLRPSS